MLERAARPAVSRPGSNSWERVAISVAAAMLAIVGLSSRSLAAQDEKVDAGPRTERVLQTDDKWQIYITYYAAPGERESVTKEAPVVVLLHGDKENRLVWEGERGLAPKLQHDGYAVITVDLRKHGQSTNVARLPGDSPAGGKSGDGTNLQSTDYQNMVEFDMEAVKKFIYEQHQAKKLNMNKMAIVGAESAAAVALCYAVADWSKPPFEDAPSDELKTPRGQDVRALVLVSPTAKVKGLSVGQILSAVRNPEWNIAIATLVGKLNKGDLKDASTIHHKLFGTTKANEDRIYLVSYPANVHGTDLFRRKETDAATAVEKFLRIHLNGLRDAEWRDRQNRLSKK